MSESQDKFQQISIGAEATTGVGERKVSDRYRCSCGVILKSLSTHKDATGITVKFDGETLWAAYLSDVVAWHEGLKPRHDVKSRLGQVLIYGQCEQGKALVQELKSAMEVLNAAKAPAQPE
jgi:hypothetical protein